MAIPKYDEMYRQFLDCLVDMQIHKSKEVKDRVAKILCVTDEERRKLLPSGRQAVFDNRIGWAGTYLKKAGLIESPARGTYRLTDAGKKVLADNPSLIDNHYLAQFETFRNFIRASVTEEVLSTELSSTGQSPQDNFDQAYQQINAALADELMSEVMKQAPSFFEHLVLKLLERMGYGGSLDGAGTVVGQSGDVEINGIIREDRLGFNLIYIQAMRWKRDKTIGSSEVQKFINDLARQGASKGLFITTAQFTQEARAYANEPHTTKVVLVDGPTLAKLMMEYNLGVSTEATYEIKRIDMNFFIEDAD